MDINYSDIILIFDFDPPDNLFTSNKTIEILKYFNESSDMGKLYINYPMVESFYHMNSIPDPLFQTYIVKYDEIKKYKSTVNKICPDYKKISKTKYETNIVIKSNLDKSKKIINDNLYDDIKLLTKQCEHLNDESKIFVVSTCCFYILDYNPKLIE